VEAVVLRTKGLREADKIITIFSRERGKLRVMAYGVAKAKSRNRGAVQPLCHSKMLLYQGRNIDTVRQCAGLNYFTELLANLDKLMLGFYLCELVDILCAENEPNEPLFVLLLTTLKWLDHPTVDYSGAEKLRAGFEIKMLGLLGYLPELNCCVHCGAALTPKLTFSALEGGLLCNHCAESDPKSLKIKLPTVHFLHQLISTKPKELPTLTPESWVFKEAQRILTFLTRYYLERRAKSLDLLATLYNYPPKRDK
jgi:DNA repair protein RecO (recombination protein O)